MAVVKKLTKKTKKENVRERKRKEQNKNMKTWKIKKTWAGRRTGGRRRSGLLPLGGGAQARLLDREVAVAPRLSRRARRGTPFFCVFLRLAVFFREEERQPHAAFGRRTARSARGRRVKRGEGFLGVPPAPSRSTIARLFGGQPTTNGGARTTIRFMHGPPMGCASRPPTSGAAPLWAGRVLRHPGTAPLAGGLATRPRLIRWCSIGPSSAPCPFFVFFIICVFFFFRGSL